MRKFERYSEARVYVMDSSLVSIVKDVIKEMSEFEYEYLPDDLITHICEFPLTVNVGKFDDLDLDELCIRCFKRNAPIMIYEPPKNNYEIK